MAATGLPKYDAKADDVADHLGVDRATVYRWCKTTNIPHRRVGTTIRFNIAEVDAWSARGEVEAA